MIKEDAFIKELNNYTEALNSKYNNNQIKAMREDMNSLAMNQTLTLIPNPRNTKIFSCKWIFKKKKSVLGDED